MTPERTRPIPSYLTAPDKIKLRRIINKIRTLLDCQEVPLRVNTAGITGVPCYDCRQLAKVAMRDYDKLLATVAKRKHTASNTKTTNRMSSET